MFFLDEQRRLAFREGGSSPAQLGAARVEELARQGLAKARGLRDDLIRLGVAPDRVRVVFADDVNAVKGRHVSDTHRVVSEEYGKDAAKARQLVADAVFESIPVERRAVLDRAVADAFGEHFAGKTVLVWNRRSGLSPGGAYPELDMTDTFLGQFVDFTRDRFPDGRVVLVGDPVSEGFKADRPDLFGAGSPNLLKFWSTYRLDGRAEQISLPRPVPGTVQHGLGGDGKRRAGVAGVAGYGHRVSGAAGHARRQGRAVDVPVGGFVR